MGMVHDYELTTSFLVGGLGGTRERLDKTLRRLYRREPLDAQDDLECLLPDCRSPSSVAIINQTLRDLTDVWSGLSIRKKRFKETDRLFSHLKDKTLESLGQIQAVGSDYHRLARYLDVLKLDSNQEGNGFGQF